MLRSVLLKRLIVTTEKCKLDLRRIQDAFDPGIDPASSNTGASMQISRKMLDGRHSMPQADLRAS